MTTKEPTAVAIDKEVGRLMDWYKDAHPLEPKRKAVANAAIKQYIAAEAARLGLEVPTDAQ